MTAVDALPLRFKTHMKNVNELIADLEVAANASSVIQECEMYSQLAFERGDITEERHLNVKAVMAKLVASIGAVRDTLRDIPSGTPHGVDQSIAVQLYAIAPRD